MHSKLVFALWVLDFDTQILLIPKMFLSEAGQLCLSPREPLATGQVLSSRKMEEQNVLWVAVKISLVFAIQIDVS